jgi:hypothetical protein
MDAHKPEYEAAASGMAETYGSPAPAPAVGDFVNGITAGKHWGGYVQEVRGGRAIVDVDGDRLEVSLSDITTR